MKKIAEGLRRVIYQHSKFSYLVVKVQKNPDDDHNLIEWNNWQKYKGTANGQWLAPCHSISRDHQTLVQAKVYILPKAPKNVPEFLKVLGDWHNGVNGSPQWGLLDCTTVLVDYGDKKL
jgi:hypothetical protein